jgi:hypothetical protein
VTRLRRAGALLACLLLPIAGGHRHASPASASRKPVSLRVLFIGNSLTYFNDLPAAVSDVALAAGDTVAVSMVALPNYALIDHLTEHGGAEEAIRRGGWDYVVLQQGPTRRPVDRDSLILWTGMFDPIIRSVGAVPALFMTWPPADHPEDLDAVRRSFQSAAESVHGVFLPAGIAWADALARDATLALYAADGFHPSPVGSYLAALAIYEKLTGHDARTVPPYAFIDGAPLHLPTATVRLLQAAAHQADSAY